MLHRMVQRFAYMVLVIAFTLQTTRAVLGESGTAQETTLEYPGYGASPGDESVDVIFVIDGSGSMEEGTGFQLQRESIAAAIDPDSPHRILPSDGTVAVAIVQFSAPVQGGGPGAQVDMPLRVINSEDAARDMADWISSGNNITLRMGGTVVSEGLLKAQEVISGDAGTTGAFGSERLVIVSTDGEPAPSDIAASLEKADEIRTGTLGADGRTIPTRICSVLVNNPCWTPPQLTPEQFLRKLANTWDAPPDVTQPIGHFSCATGIDDLGDWVGLCSTCLCPYFHRGEDDCNSDCIPDTCELDTDSDELVDVCDPDLDGDGVANEHDNCPYLANSNQADCDNDQIGDACQHETDCNSNQRVGNAGQSPIS